MNHELKRRWCAALRGGTWRQKQGGYESTAHKELRCAVGVLAAVTEPNHPTLEASHVINRLIEQNDASYFEIGSVISMNDEGEPFAEIADWIEENL